MGKGGRPRRNAPRQTVEVREKAKGASGSSTSAGRSKVAIDQCWTFSLVDVTQAGKAVASGTSVRGAVSHNRVAVLAKGVLGYAPPKQSREMISNLVRTGESLAGKIDSKATNGDLEVTLCLS